MQTRRRIRTVLCGIGGYGGFYLGNFLGREESPLEFVGCVDPFPERAPHAAELRAVGVPIHATLEAFYAAAGAELAVVASPIQFHAEQTVCALEHGSHVLCEKPLCASLADAERMLAAQRRTGRIVAIGYQGSYAESTWKLKADIQAGVWGRPREMKCVVRWPRGLDYYGRNAWAGRIRDSQGRMVLDSPLNNATAHFLHHMLYLLGEREDTCATPSHVEAQLYRANDIENYDTAFLLAGLSGGVRLLFVTTHAVEEHDGPAFAFAFEHGSVAYRLPGGEVVGTFRDGRQVNYGRGAPRDRDKVTDIVAAIREGRPTRCGIEAALGQTRCMLAAQESGWPVVPFPPSCVRSVEQKGVPVRVVDGLADAAMRAFETGELPDPVWASWVRPGRRMKVDGLEGGGPR